MDALTWIDWVEWIVKAIVLFLILLVGFGYLTLMERKVLARIQSRYGPNRAGKYGLLQWIADAFKLIFKEELIPTQADKIIFILAPMLTVIPALTLLAVTPFGGTVSIFGRPVALGIAGDINIGILYISALASVSVYGIVLAGWSSNNKYATMGGIRSSAQMISYELALGLSWIGPVMLASSLSLGEIIRRQMEIGWFVLYQPLGFLLFYIASLAEINRPPFDMPEAEQELTAGYHVEYSGMKFALFMMTEYVKVIVISVIGVTLFWGGYHGPGVDQLPWLGPLYLIGKVIFMMWTIIWVRGTLPRFRYDRLMAFGWKVLLPVGLANVFLTALIILLFPGWFGI